MSESFAIVKPLAEFQERPINWQWRGRLARGAITLMAGPAGLGKSLVARYISAAVTTGATFPDGQKCEAGTVFLICGEEDIERTTLPSFRALGGNPAKVMIVTGNANLPPKVAQALARHSTITLTMDRYAHQDRAYLAKHLVHVPALPASMPALQREPDTNLAAGRIEVGS